jgi:hypothetical protein
MATSQNTVDTIARYFDGSGTYTITRVGDILTTTLSNSNDEEFETFDMLLTRNTALDFTDWGEWVLTNDFASDGDRMAVLIRGKAFDCEFI